MINYQNIQDSILHYESEEFIRIESPWTVNSQVSEITNPHPVPSPLIEGTKKTLVASGEQSFLYLMVKGFLPKGRFQTVTPCFRFQDSFNKDHAKYFLKNELIHNQSESKEDLLWMLHSAWNFFSRYADILFFIEMKNEKRGKSTEQFKSLEDLFSFLNRHSYRDLVNNAVIDLSVDIGSDILELGSYGFREYEGFFWIFGTGLAEPRFSSAINAWERR